MNNNDKKIKKEGKSKNRKSMRKFKGQKVRQFLTKKESV
jgi:hypothetical protein